MPKHNQSLSAAALARVCEVVGRFDAAWHAVAQGGKPPWIEEALRDVAPAERPVYLKNLLAVELECRSAFGEQPTPEEYVSRFPRFAELVADAFQELEHDAAETTLGEESIITKPDPPKAPEWQPRPAQSPGSLPVQPGDVLHDYQLLDQIGQGGMGAVFKARHTRLRKTVALKVLSPERLRDPGAVARFQREMEAVGQLRDPHVVEAYDAGEARGVHYLVMEFVEGLDAATIQRRRAGGSQSPSATALSADKSPVEPRPSGPVDLDRHPARQGGSRASALPDTPSNVRRAEAREPLGQAQVAGDSTSPDGRGSTARAPIPVADVCEIIRQAALGLHHAHQRGLIHRDIKPSNLLVSADGVVKVLDMGLARLHSEHPSGDLTSTGQVMGTVDYIAPEQIVNSHQVDLRADLYSMGCSMYHLLAGEAPFAGPSYSTVYLKMKAHENTPPPRIPRADIPGGVLAVLEKLLRKKPDERYSTAAEVAAALTPFTQGSDLVRLVGFMASDANLIALQQQPTSEFTTEATVRRGTRFPFHRPATSARFRRVLTAIVGLIALGGFGSWLWTNTHRELPPISQADNRVQNQNPITESPQSVSDPEYATAEWVLSVGGTIVVRVGDERIEVADAKQLPPREFQLIQVVLRQPQGMTQRDFERFQGLQNLEYFEASDVAGLRDAWMSPLRGLPRLKDFKLSSGGKNDLHITDAIIPLLQSLPTLEQIHFFQDGYLSDAGVAEIAKLPTLRWFSSMSPALTDNAWLAFANSQVTGLYLQAPNLTSKSVVNAAKCPKLEYLAVKGELLKDDALVALGSCSSLRSLRVTTNATDNLVTHIASLPQLRAVFIEVGTVSDAGVASLVSQSQIETLELTRVPVTDQGLLHLQSCSQLSTLHLLVTQVTPAGLAKFKAARPDVRVRSDIVAAELTPPWPLGPSENVIPGLVARPTKLPGIKRWQVTTVASRGQHSLGLAYGPQGEIAVGSNDGLIRCYSDSDLRLVRVIDAHRRNGGPSGAEVLALDWSADGQSLLSSGRDAVRVWDRTGKPIREWRSLGGSYSVSWHPDGKRFAVGNAVGVSMVSLDSDVAEQKLIAGDDIGAAVRLSPNGEWVATWHRLAGGSLRLWSSTGKPAATLAENIAHIFAPLSWSPDSTRVASGTTDGKVHVWSVSGESLAVWDTKEVQLSIAWHPTQPLLAACTVQGSVFLWNVDQPDQLPKRWVGNHPIHRLAWNADGTKLVTTDEGQILRTFDQQLRPLLQSQLTLSSSLSTGLAWSPDSRRLVTGGGDGLLRGWTSTGLLCQAVLFHDAGPRGMAWSPNASRLVIAQENNSSFRWLDGATLQGSHFSHPVTVPCDVAWRSDSQAFAIVGSLGKLLFFEEGVLPKLTNEVMAHEGDCLAVDWSADDELLATGGRDQVVRLWKPNGERVAELKGHFNAVNDVAWSPRGDRLASCGDDDSIRLWNRDGSLRKVIGDNDRPVPDMHRWGVHGLAWKPNGESFVSCSIDGTVRLWSDNGEPLGRYPAPVWEQFTGIAWTHDSKWIAARSLFNMVYVWNAETRALAWQSVLLPGGRAVTFSSAGELLTGDLHLLTHEQRATLGIGKSDTPDLALTKSLDQTLIYILDRDDGQQELLKPSEFHRRFAEPNPKLAQPADLDRAAAEWALSIGGQVTIQHGGGSQNVSRRTELPPGVFHVVAVKFDGGDVTDEGLLKLRGLSSLADLRLTNTPRVTPKGMQVVTSLPNLGTLILDNKSFTDDHLLPLRDCRKLGHLILNASVTDSAANVLAQLPELSYLGLTQSQFTNDGLKRLLATPKLSSMELGSEKITDEGLLLLANDPRWTILNLGPPLTSKGIEYLGRLPNLTYLGLAGNLPDGSFDVSRLPKLQTLSFSRGGIDRELTADHLSRIAHFRQIEALLLRFFTDIDLSGLNDLSKLNRLWSIAIESVPLTDEGLARLVEIRSLRQVTLHNTKVTPAGLAKFKAARPDVIVEGDVGAPDPAAERAAAEWVLNRGEEVWVRVDGQDRQVRTQAELPPGPFVVSHLALRKAEPISEEGMQRLSKLSQLEGLHLVGIPNSGEFIKALPPQSYLSGLLTSEISRPEGVIESLRRHPRFKVLQLPGTRLKDRDFEQLASFRGLVLLNLYGTGVTDQQLAHIATLPELNDLNLADNPDLTAAGIRSLSALPQLRQIAFHNADESVVIAATELPHLTSLEVDVLEFTDKVIESLSASRITKLSLNGNVPVSKRQPLNREFCQRLSRLKQLDFLRLGNFPDTLPIFEPGAITVLASMPQLKELVFEWVPITDNDLLTLTDFKALRQLMLANTKVTPAGLTKFKAARPEVQVETDIR